MPALEDNKDMHLWLTENPTHHLKGDFSLSGGRVKPLGSGGEALTYSGISLFRMAYFKQLRQQPKVLPLGPLLKQAAQNGRASGERLPGQWTDVCTPERLTALNN